MIRHYLPVDDSWYEQKFAHKVELVRVLQPSGQFFRVKQWLLDDEDRWGTYKEDWYASMRVDPDQHTVAYSFYFLDGMAAMWFRLAVDL